MYYIWYLNFWSKVNIWNVNCARATAFIFNTRTGVLGKVSKFLRQKMSLPEGGLEPPTFWFMPNALTYWAIRTRHLLPHVVEYWLWRYRYFWSKVKIWNLTPESYDIYYLAVFTIHPRCTFTANHWSLVSIYVNTLKPKPNGHRFADEIFKVIIVNQNCWNLTKKITEKCSQMFNKQYANIGSEWLGAGQATSHYLNQWWPSWPMYMYVTRPKRVNTPWPRENRRHFTDVIFQFIFFKWKFWIFRKDFT